MQIYLGSKGTMSVEVASGDPGVIKVMSNGKVNELMYRDAKDLIAMLEEAADKAERAVVQLTKIKESTFARIVPA